MSTPITVMAELAELPAKPEEQAPRCITSEQVLADWEYGVDFDFKSSEGVPARWAPAQPAQWGQESKKIQTSAASADLLDMFADLAISADPSGSFIAVAFGKDIYIYSLDTRELVETLSGHGAPITQLAFSPQLPSGPDGIPEIVLTSSSHNRGGYGSDIIVWKLDPSGKDLNPPPPQPDLDSLTKTAMSAVMERLLEHGWTESEQAVSDLVGGVRQSLEAAMSKHKSSHRSVIEGSFFNFGSPVFSRDGSRLLYQTQSKSTQFGGRSASELPCINIWSIKNSSVEQQLLGHTDTIMWAAFSPDDKLIASVAWDGTVRIWDSAKGEIKQRFGSFGGQMWAGTFSPGSTHIAFSLGSPSTVVFVYNVNTGVQVAKMHDIQHWARSLDWSPDGSLVAAGGENGQLSVWDPFTGVEKQKWQLSNKGLLRGRSMISVTNVQFVDQGRKLIFTTTDGSIEGYSFLSNEKYHIEPGAAALNGPLSLYWVPKLQSIVSAHRDGALRFWSLQEEYISALSD